MTESDFPPLGKPAQRALAKAGYSRLEQLAKISEADTLQLHGTGPKALGQLRRALAASDQPFARGSQSPSRRHAEAAIDHWI